MQKCADGLGGVITGTGRLSLNYAIAPTAGPATITTIVLNGTGATAGHIIRIGAVGGADNTFSGGLDLRTGPSPTPGRRRSRARAITSTG